MRVLEIFSGTKLILDLKARCWEGVMPKLMLATSFIDAVQALQRLLITLTADKHHPPR